MGRDGALVRTDRVLGESHLCGVHGRTGLVRRAQGVGHTVKIFPGDLNIHAQLLQRFQMSGAYQENKITWAHIKRRNQ